MKRLALLVTLSAALLAPDTVRAQAAPPTDIQLQTPTDTQLQMERQHRRVIVRPTPSPETIERDMQQAVAEAEQRERQQEIVRDLRRPLPRRPDLGYDVNSGIQSQRLHDALRR
jgi:hypothetical protein